MRRGLRLSPHFKKKERIWHMAKFIGKRLLMLLPVVLGVVFIVFTILRLSPTDPIRTVLGDMATEEAVK